MGSWGFLAHVRNHKGSSIISVWVLIENKTRKLYCVKYSSVCEGKEGKGENLEEDLLEEDEDEEEEDEENERVEVCNVMLIRKVMDNSLVLYLQRDLPSYYIFKLIFLPSYDGNWSLICT